MKKIEWILFGIIISTIGCQKNSTDHALPSYKGTPQKITATYTDQPQSTLMHVAMANGYFKEEGLDVTPVKRSFGKAALRTVLDGQSDFATVAETPVVFSVLNGDKIYVVANIEASNLNNAIVARKSAGIAVPSDLKGKRIGYSPGTTSDFFLDSILTVNGMTRKEIRPVGLAPDEMLAAMQSKQVDAVSTWNYPLTLIRQALGDDGTVFYDREIYTETFNIAAKQDYVDSHPEAVKAFLRALIKAETFVAGNPAEAQAIMSKDTNIDVKLIREVWDAFSYRVVIDQTLLITLEDETRWAMKNKLTTKTEMPDYLSYIHLDSLRSIDAEAIKLNR